MDVLGIIPARSGSKRVPNKNIRELDGKPLIAHTIEQAASASVLDRCIVSTDDEEIAAVARKHNGDVPFLRPDHLATDNASSADVVAHALEWVHQQGYEPTIVVLLQVTTPLRTAGDIDSAIEKLQNSASAQSVVSVSDFITPPLWSVKQNKDGFLTTYFEPDMLWKDDIPRSQDLPDIKHPNGAVFGATVDEFKEQKSFYTDRTLEYKMPIERSIDIDEPYELKIAQALIRDD